MKKCFPGQCPHRPYADDLACYCHKVVKNDDLMFPVDLFAVPVQYGGAVLTAELIEECFQIMLKNEQNWPYLN